jgi:hypothetical protein
MVIFCRQEGSQKKISYYHYPYGRAFCSEQVLYILPDNNNAMGKEYWILNWTYAYWLLCHA